MAITPADQMLAEIRPRPHWRVLIEPSTYAIRFETKSAARDAVRKAAVLFRGWDYPHFHEDTPYGGNAYGGNAPFALGWESWTEFSDFEAWRIMTSGQFLHYKTLHEDSNPTGWGTRADDGPFLDISSTVYHVTEMLAFAGRLTEQEDYRPGVTISVGVTGLQDRTLTTDPNRVLFREYRCLSSDDVVVVRVLQSPSPVVAVRELAIDMSIEIFEWFKFEPDRQIIREIQDKLIRGRF